MMLLLFTERTPSVLFDFNEDSKSFFSSTDKNGHI